MFQIISDIELDSPYDIFIPDHTYKTCTGCLSCWLKTPGECVLGQDINASIIKSKHFIIITKSSFGSYSSRIKRLIDRTIPMVLPTFKSINGELHHKARYKSYPSIHVISYDAKSDFEKSVMKDMVSAHAVNLHAPNHSLHFCDIDKIKESLDQLIGGLHE